jgi:glycosyltransferase involved in cell wall biosynthesis
MADDNESGQNSNASPDAPNKYSLSIFFPCYNEEYSIETLVGKTVETASSITSDYEIIIVNDGSSDKTGQIAEKLAEQIEQVRVVHHQTNSGYGAALQTGFKAATKELVFYTDGDGQFDIGELPNLLPLIAECDIVSGYRINRQDGFIRKLNALCWGTLVCILFKMRIRDIDGAFKLYKRQIFDNIEMQSTGALIDTEILARALRKGYTIKQIGVKHYPRMAGTQTGANLSVILRAFKELFKLRKEIMRN